ncbi:MAG TPA: hypothetical protein VFN40_08050 [Gemmatimonadales bacterium]|jgi:hypothetical protein|nr:hypothetical protein [Gemmatimonadales bacterium]
MDHDILQGVAGVLGIMIPLSAITIGGLLLLSRSRIGEAIARRIAGDTRDPECEAQLEALEDEIGRLKAQLGETNERLDFTERLLTRGDASRRDS